MSAKEPDAKQEGEARAKAFEQAYKDSHADGSYPPVEIKQRKKG